MGDAKARMMNVRLVETALVVVGLTMAIHLDWLVARHRTASGEHGGDEVDLTRHHLPCSPRCVTIAAIPGM